MSLNPRNRLTQGSLPVARGISVIPKSVTPSRIEENLRVITLEQSDLDSINAIHKSKGLTRYVYPPFGFNFGFPDKQ